MKSLLTGTIAEGLVKGFQEGMLRQTQGSGVWVLEEEGGTTVLQFWGRLRLKQVQCFKT